MPPSLFACSPLSTLWRLWLLISTAFLLGLAAPSFALDPPAVRGYVNDYAHLLKPNTVLEIEEALRAFAESDSTQVAVLTIDSLEGDSLEDFSIRTVDKWGVGQRGKDNGVLLLVVKKERKVRIEVGRGLEGVLTDLATGRIIDRVMRPLFKEGRFDEGMRTGVEAIIQASRGEFVAESRPARKGRGQEPPPIMSYLLFGLFIIALLGRASRPLGVMAGAVLIPLFGYFGLPSITLLLLLMLIPVGAVLGLLLPFMSGHMLMMGGGSRGGGGFGGGGFSGFGGGGFGGGGASGDW